MNTFTTPVLAALLLLAATGGPSQATDATAAGTDRSPAYVDSTEIRYLESYPVQVQLFVSGTLPTPCHEAAYEVQDLGSSIDVLLWSVADPTMMCTQVLEPFELSIPLGSYEAADLPVQLNAQEIGRIEVGDVTNVSSVTGAGWSFGFCLGYCRADLAIDADRLRLTGHDRDAEMPVFTNSGSLTAAGAARLEAAVVPLAGVSLEAVYGCPDCADGGAAYVVIVRDGVPERVEMEFGKPPEQLAELYQTTQSMMQALETCLSNEWVEVAPDCDAYQRE